MSAHKSAYLIRRIADGTMRTVISTSARTAVQEFVIKYLGLEAGEDLKVKERLSSDEWETFRYQGGGHIRKVG